MEINTAAFDKRAKIYSILRNEYKDVCTYLEEQRSKLNKMTPLLWIFLLLLSAVPIIFLIVGSIVLVIAIIYFTNIFGILFFILGISGLIIYKKKHPRKKVYKYKNYCEEYRSMLISKLMPVYFDSIQHLPQQFISEKLFSQSIIDKLRPIKFKGEDLFKGDFNGIPMAFSEVSTKGFLGNSGAFSLFQGAFTGVLFIMAYPIKFKYKTIVVPDNTEKHLGDYAVALQKTKYKEKLVRLEDPRFEKLFMVISEDQVEARYILNPTMMEYLCELQEKSSIELSFAFANNKLFIALPSVRNIFNPDINITVKESVEITFQYIEIIATIAEDIYSLHKSMNADAQIFR